MACKKFAQTNFEHFNFFLDGDGLFKDFNGYGHAQLLSGNPFEVNNRWLITLAVATGSGSHAFGDYHDVIYAWDTWLANCDLTYFV
jgi:hypothetical protein